MAIGLMPEWFQEWFGEEYLQLYPHRDAGEAARLARLVTSRVRLPDSCRMLDVGCGPGRHLQAFEALGLRPIGLDLSATLLARARQTAAAPLIRADMRYLPVRPGAFDLVVNLFTSFGYFATDEEHVGAIGEMGGALRAGGWLVLDFLNAPAVASGLVARESKVLGSTRVEIERHLSEGRVVKTIRTADGRAFVERVRLFGLTELSAMIGRAGLRLHSIAGDYDGAGHSDASPRLILFAERS